jgi:splicing factor 1
MHSSITGTNNIPLGKRKFKSKVEGEDSSPPSQTGSDSHSADRQPTSPTHSNSGAPSASNGHTGEKGKKRRSRWGESTSKVSLPGLPTTLPANITKDQMNSYLSKYFDKFYFSDSNWLLLVYLRLEEINLKLRTGDYMPPNDRRSPSPEPVYGADGKRVNTREYRYRKKLEDERNKIIESAIAANPDFKPPPDYRRPSKLQEKVSIPVDDFPDINFIGLLIGPRGNTLKNMESESGAKISIRGKGSVKEGKRSDNPTPDQDEPLHCLVTADSEDKVKKAVQLIRKIIATSSNVPEGMNELKRSQLRELAALNGTLRDDESQICSNCGAVGHRRFECPETQNVTTNLICRICNGVGHTARDCMQRNNPEALEQAKQRDIQLNSEYMNLMAALGEKVSTTTPTQPDLVAEQPPPPPPATSAPYNPQPTPGSYGSAKKPSTWGTSEDGTTVWSRAPGGPINQVAPPPPPPSGPSSNNNWNSYPPPPPPGYADAPPPPPSSSQPNMGYYYPSESLPYGTAPPPPPPSGGNYGHYQPPPPPSGGNYWESQSSYPPPPPPPTN